MSPSPPPSVLRAFLDKKGGAASWRDWMEAALYDPANGYYTKHIRTVGRGGDFSTSATLDGELGGAIAAWVRGEWRRAGRKLPVIEIGPGDGSLHHRVLGALGFSGRWGLRSLLVERSPVLQGVQREKLRGRGGKVTWHETVETALDRCGGEVVIFSNELADAFPAHLFQLEKGAWQEVWLRIAESGGIVEELRPPAPGVTSSAFFATPWPEGLTLESSAAVVRPSRPYANGGDWKAGDWRKLPHKAGTGLLRHPPPGTEGPGVSPAWPEGQRIEVLDSWRKWLEGWVPRWKNGAMLTIDYGGAPGEIYFRRPGGTVRGYFHHQRLDSMALYPLMGRCDVTVDVNFTDLIQWGEAAGLRTEQCVSQREFVQAPEANPLYEAGGAAEAFQCLVQRPPCGP